MTSPGIFSLKQARAETRALFRALMPPFAWLLAVQIETVICYLESAKAWQNAVNCARLRGCFSGRWKLSRTRFCASMGLAEIALRSAKLAHVVHHYGAAARTAPDAALTRFAQREADYYELLSNDEEYLDAEVKRISRLQNMQHTGRMAARVALAAAAFGGAFLFLDDQVAAAAWSLALAASIAWCGVAIGSKLLTNRSKLRRES
ncbi:MAG: hypothetical protein WKF84_06710 [Pyrinomonadaceae bacterium]